MTNPARRSSLLERAFTESLSVRDLKRVVRPRSTTTSVPALGLAAALRDLSARAHGLTGAREHVTSAALKPLRESTGLDDAEVAALQRTIHALRQMMRFIEQVLPELERAAKKHHVGLPEDDDGVETRGPGEDE